MFSTTHSSQTQMKAERSNNKFRPTAMLLATGLAIGCLTGCGGGDSPSNVGTPGSEKSGTTKILEAGAATLQRMPPVKQINVYLDGFHFHSGMMDHQMEAHHCCSVLNEDVKQCVLFDGNTENAKMIGIEYIISEKLFKTLPEEEKALWHSHLYEVKSGQLIGPGLPDVAEHKLMDESKTTYGKTWHTWDTSNPTNQLPLGIPMLMMGFTADGQAKPEMIAARDRRMNVSTEEKRKQRANIADVPIAEGADAWQKGKVVTLQRVEKKSQETASK